ncbi:MAG: hypothetical protein CMB25_07070 [Euryarchaeota archaeon]|nr:hypothetical protein [Euryarchaeota archaeon]|tara:strand:+ start:3263 stop:3568 length:306 start_codon:yes stop_codon:yes gene_type:complete
MKIVRFSELGENVRDAMKGVRWILLDQDELQNALSALMFAELDGVLVAVDHRKSTPDDGLWRRAVHLLLVTERENADEIRQKSGITKVISNDIASIEEFLW